MSREGAISAASPDALLRALRDERIDGIGVADWTLRLSRSRHLSLGIKDSEAGNVHAPLNVAEATGLGYLFVWDDGKISRGSLESGQYETDPVGSLRHARSAAYDDPDAAVVLGPAEMPSVALHAPRAAALAGGDIGLLEQRLRQVRECVDTPVVRTWSGSFGAGEGATLVLTSRGLEAAARATTFDWYVGVNGEFWDGHGGRAPDTEESFLARLERTLATARDLARPAEPMDAGQAWVLLHPHVVEQYALPTLLHALDGASLDRGDSRFRIEQFGSGEAVLRGDFTLRIDPLLPLRRGSYCFTGSGLPATPCTFVENGRLVRPVLDLKHARRLGLEPTPLPAGMDTLFLEGPPRMPLSEAMQAGAGGGLVLSVLGVHTQDPASGDFSLAAPQVLRLGSDGPEGRMRATLAGNLFELFQDDATRLVEFDGEHTPGMLVRCRLDPK